MADCVIKNGIVVTPSEKIRGGVAIKGERVAFVGEDSALPEADKVIDAQGNLIIPGFIEAHSHLGLGTSFRVGFEKAWQTEWQTDSEAAIHGGVTTIRTFLTFMKPYLPTIDEYITSAAANSYTDFGINPTITLEDHFDELIPMAKKGMPCWKTFYDPYQGEEGRQISLAHTDSGMLYRAFEILGGFGYPGLVMLHAEEYSLYTMLQNRLMKAGRKDLRAWTESRPNICESMKIHASAMVCEEVGGAPLYIVHMSTKEGVDICRDYQAKGVQVIPETMPHYLVHTLEDADRLGVWGKVNPPFRQDADVDRLWKGLATGIVRTMGTDSCSYAQEDKEANLGQFGDVWKAMPGLSGGMQHWLPTMMTEGFRTGRLTIEQIVKVCSENSAKTFGIYPRKGALSPGSDADIVIVDPDKEATVGEGFYKGANKTWSDVWGKKLKGMPVLTMTRGKVVMENGQTVGTPGYGEFIPSKKY